MPTGKNSCPFTVVKSLGGDETRTALSCHLESENEPDKQKVELRDEKKLF